MFKFTTIYHRVDDENALEAFFSSVHMPTAEKLTGLVKSEVSRVTGKPGGESRYHLMYEIYFDSADSFHRALVTQEGIALLQAIKPWGDAKIITWFYADSWEE